MLLNACMKFWSNWMSEKSCTTQTIRNSQLSTKAIVEEEMVMGCRQLSGLKPKLSVFCHDLQFCGYIGPLCWLVSSFGVTFPSALLTCQGVFHPYKNMTVCAYLLYGNKGKVLLITFYCQGSKLFKLVHFCIYIHSVISTNYMGVI